MAFKALDVLNDDNKLDIHVFDRSLLKSRNMCGADLITLNVSGNKSAKEREREIRKWKESIGERSRRFSNDKYVSPKEASQQLIAVTPLANPRGTASPCELCGRQGRYLCRGCGVSYFCSRQHRLHDQIHSKVCYRFYALRHSTPVTSSQLEREMILSQRAVLKEELVNEIIEVALDCFYKNDFIKAKNSLYQCIKLTKEIFGEESSQMVTLYSYKARSELYNGNPIRCSKTLSLAQDILNRMRPKLRRKLKCTEAIVYLSMALLYTYEQDFDNGRFYAAEAVYHFSEKFGPYSTQAAIAFFNLGHVQAKSNQTANAINTFEHFARLVFTKLQAEFEKAIDQTQVRYVHVILEDTHDRTGLNWIDQLECIKDLKILENFFKKQDVFYPLPNYLLQLDLGILFFLRREFTRANNQIEVLKSFPPIEKDDINEVKKTLIKHIGRAMHKMTREPEVEKRTSQTQKILQ